MHKAKPNQPVTLETVAKILEEFKLAVITSMNDLKTQVAGLEKRVAGLEKRVAGLESRIDRLEKADEDILAAVADYAEVTDSHLIKLDEQVRIIRSTMVTKDYLDRKVSDLRYEWRGDIAKAVAGNMPWLKPRF